ncbi:MAG: M13 family metallopeptidase [Betaproteobacteria bacterium]
MCRRSLYPALAFALLPALAAAQPTPVLDLTNLGPPAQACTDFFDDVNGKWSASTEIPPDQSRVGGFNDLVRANTRKLQAALEAARRAPQSLDTPGKRLAATYYASGMNLPAIEKAGLAALAPWLAEIDALSDAKQLPALVGKLNRLDVGAPISLGIAPDPGDRRREMVQLYQSGLGLSDRDEYFKDDERARAVQQAYRVYREKLWTLAGMPAAEVARLSPQVYALETRLARASMTRVELRDPKAIYNPAPLADLPKLARFDWPAYFAGAGIPAPPGTVNVAQPDFVQVVGQAMSDTPLDVWRAYLRLRLLDEAAPHLPQAYADAHFDYHQRTLRGSQQRKPRGEEVIETISGPFGSQPLAEGLGQIFVAETFSPEAKRRAVLMVEDIRTAMAARIQNLPWMSEPTRARAQRKLAAMSLKVGYPDRWKTYDGLRIAADDYAGNWLRAAQWDFERRVADLQHPVDRSRWWMGPHIVNAYAGGLNEIVFPAGILQPPFFNAQADDAVNYGGIGSVIGHEITHHFDDRGRQFDEVGNLADWWTTQDAKVYGERAAALAAQFDGYEPLPGQRINGKQTLGENISDLGGIAIAYDGLRLALARRDPGPIDGLTPQQRFFVSYASIWRQKIRPELLAEQVRTGQHSPARYRVLGPLANSAAFAQAFSCPADAPMLRAEEQRSLIW